MRRGFLICGLLMLARLALYFLPPVVVDDALIANWRVNRATFEQLVSLYLADDLDQYVSSTGSYSVQSAYPGPHREIVFLLTAGQHVRQLIWAKEPLGGEQEAVDPTRCRRLEANWYFCSW
jgi:hypothetical protein